MRLYAEMTCKIECRGLFHDRGVAEPTLESLVGLNDGVGQLGALAEGLLLSTDDVQMRSAALRHVYPRRCVA